MRRIVPVLIVAAMILVSVPLLSEDTAGGNNEILLGGNQLLPTKDPRDVGLPNSTGFSFQYRHYFGSWAVSNHILYNTQKMWNQGYSYWNGKRPAIHLDITTLTLGAEYHFASEKQFSPYLGAGASLLWLSDNESHTIVQQDPIDPSKWNYLHFDKSGPSLGIYVGAGLDIRLQGNLLINLDAKYFNSNLKMYRWECHYGCETVDEHLDYKPVILSIHIGWRW